LAGGGVAQALPTLQRAAAASAASAAASASSASARCAASACSSSSGPWKRTARMGSEASELVALGLRPSSMRGRPSSSSSNTRGGIGPAAEEGGAWAVNGERRLQGATTRGS
jgi:hypothetical protein